MFGRRKNEEINELDAAWEDEAPKNSYVDSAFEDESSEDSFAFEDETAAEVEFSAEEDTEEILPAEQAKDTSEAEVEEVEAETVKAAFQAGEDAVDGEVEAGSVEEVAPAEQAQGEVEAGSVAEPELEPESEAEFETEAAPEAESEAVAPGALGRHDSGLTTKQAQLEQMPEHQKRSRRMRRVLRVVIVLLLALMAALAYFGWRLYQESRVTVEQETSDVITEVEIAAETEEVAPDMGTASTKKTTVPNLLELLGKTQDEAVAALGSGAAVTLDSEITEATSPMMHRVTVVLTEEPTDTKSGTPTVYLGMGPDEKVVVVGYSAATASLGYGTLSFADVVTNEHVVENTLGEAGLSIPENSVVLPDSSAYSTYAPDGTTLIKEQCTFDGTASQAGADYLWTSVMVYNYTAANATGNLADTVRQIYVYVSNKEAASAAISEKERIAKEAEEAAKAEEERKRAEEEAAKAAQASSSAAPEAATSERGNV